MAERKQTKTNKYIKKKLKKSKAIGLPHGHLWETWSCWLCSIRNCCSNSLLDIFPLLTSNVIKKWSSILFVHISTHETVSTEFHFDLYASHLSLVLVCKFRSSIIYNAWKNITGATIGMWIRSVYSIIRVAIFIITHAHMHTHVHTHNHLHSAAFTENPYIKV